MPFSALALEVADLFIVTERSARPKSRRKLNAESEKPILKTPSSFSLVRRIFDMFTTKKPTRFWETRTACVFYKILRL